MPDAAKPLTDRELHADLAYRTLKAGYQLTRANGMEREFMALNIGLIRQHWSHPGMRAAWEHARQLGVTK